jgi:choline-glycine betaine transporter
MSKKWTIGRDLKNSGLNIKVFVPSLIILVLISIPFALNEGNALDSLNRVFEQVVTYFGWGYMWWPIITIVWALWICFSKYGKVVLGDPAEKPQFKKFEYIAILIAMGLGATIMRTGAMMWAPIAMAPPFGVTPGSQEALLWGNAYSMFLWDPVCFVLFVCAGPAMGYVIHVRKRPLLRVSEVYRCIFGDKFADGIGGMLLDIFFVIAILAGTSTFLGLGTPIVTTFLNHLFGFEINFRLTVIVTLIWIVLFTGSAYLGLEKGIKNLSTFNMYLAAIFGIFIMIAGPTVFILDFFTDTVGFYLNHHNDIIFYSDSMRTGEPGYMQRYTVFWYAYIATWSLLHSAFAAKVSKGRTIREMVLTYMIAPFALSTAVTAILGGLSIDRHLKGMVPIFDIVKEGGIVPAIPDVIATLPLPAIAMVIFLLLTIVFMVTTLDSTTYTIAAYVCNDPMNEKEPAQAVRLITAFAVSALAILLMRIGGLVPLEVLSGLMGVPIIFVLLGSMYAPIKMMNDDKAWIHNVRKTE